MITGRAAALALAASSAAIARRVDSLSRAASATASGLSGQTSLSARRSAAWCPFAADRAAASSRPARVPSPIASSLARRAPRRAVRAWARSSAPVIRARCAMAASSAAQLAAFLGWATDNAPNFALWAVLPRTGMRRGEVLSLRWRDIDLDAATVSVRRSAGMVRIAGEGAEMVEGYTKSGKPRVIDLDAASVSVLRAWRKLRGSLALQLARDDALVFGDIEGGYRNGEHVSRQFGRDIERCREALGEDALPVIRLHDLRHTHATVCSPAFRSKSCHSDSATSRRLSL